MRIAVLAMVGLAGCALATPYRRRAPVPVLAQYGAAVGAQLEQDGIPDDDAVDRVRRNQLIREVVWLVDAEYLDYESSLYLSDATLNTLTDWMLLGTTGAAAALSSGGSLVASAVLSGSAAAITGARASVQEHWFQQHAQVALIATMRALRAQALVPITKGMQQSAAGYPLSRAMVDLQTYAQAGNMITAMQSLVDSATANMGRSETELKKAKDEEHAP